MPLKFLNWNVNGIRAILKKNFSENIKKINPDVLALQEVKCDDIKLLDIIFEDLGYNYFVSTALKKGYSGVLTAWKKNITNLKVEKIPFILSNKIYKDEGRSLYIKINNLNLLNLYVPSGTSSEERHTAKLLFLDEISNNLNNIDISNLIICGDFNLCHKEIDIHHPIIAEKKNFSGFRRDEREKFSNLLDLGFFDVIRKFYPEDKIYTWWSYRANSREKNLGWRIDYFLASNQISKLIKTGTIHNELLGSDHCPVSIEILI